MPSVTLDFRHICGCFYLTFAAFMARRAQYAKKMQCRVITLRRRLSGLVFGFALSYLFWGSLLLIRCGDVEQNPGPGPGQDKTSAAASTAPCNTVQTRLSTGRAAMSAKGAPASSSMSESGPSLSLVDVMQKLNGMDASVNAKLDSVMVELASVRGQRR